ncbi:MAG: HAD family phosphatase [Pelovirga sp.]
MDNRIKYIVFDLGKVLIDYSYGDFFTLLRSRGAQIASVEDFARQVDLVAYEHGHIDCDAFLAGMNRLLADPLPEAALTRAWNDLFTPIPQMMELALQLKVRFPVFLLSNIGRLHWDFLQRSYDLDRFCHDRLASFEVGAMKPAAKIYQLAQQRFGLESEKTLFIDDKPENIAGAVACGWQGIQHRTPAATLMRVAVLTGLAE